MKVGTEWKYLYRAIDSAGQTIEFKPGSFHVMLVGLKQPLEKGQHIKATLEFEKAGKVEIEYPVEAIGATGAPAGGHSGHTGH